MNQILFHETPDLDMLSGAVRDMSQKDAFGFDNTVLERFNDTTRPKLSGAMLDNRMGILTLTFDEPINTLKVNTTGVLITDRFGGDSVPTPLESSTICLLYTSPSPRDRQKSRMPSSA